MRCIHQINSGIDDLYEVRNYNFLPGAKNGNDLILSGYPHSQMSLFCTEQVSTINHQKIHRIRRAYYDDLFLRSSQYFEGDLFCLTSRTYFENIDDQFYFRAVKIRVIHAMGLTERIFGTRVQDFTRSQDTHKILVVPTVRSVNPPVDASFKNNWLLLLTFEPPRIQMNSSNAHMPMMSFIQIDCAERIELMSNIRIFYFNYQRFGSSPKKWKLSNVEKAFFRINTLRCLIELKSTNFRHSENKWLFP